MCGMTLRKKKDNTIWYLIESPIEMFFHTSAEECWVDLNYSAFLSKNIIELFLIEELNKKQLSIPKKKK